MKPTVEKVDNEAKAMEKGKYQSTLRSKPYTVTKVKGKQVTERRDGKERIRNKTKAKLVKERPIHLQTSTNWNREQAEDSNNEPDIHIVPEQVEQRQEPKPAGQGEEAPEQTDDPRGQQQEEAAGLRRWGRSRKPPRERKRK